LHTIVEYKNFACIVFDYCDGLDPPGSSTFVGDSDAIKHIFLRRINAVRYHYRYCGLKAGEILCNLYTGQIFSMGFDVPTERLCAEPCLCINQNSKTF
jgi:hypothetical protein